MPILPELEWYTHLTLAVTAIATFLTLLAPPIFNFRSTFQLTRFWTYRVPYNRGYRVGVTLAKTDEAVVWNPQLIFSKLEGYRVAIKVAKWVPKTGSMLRTKHWPKMDPKIEGYKWHYMDGFWVSAKPTPKTGFRDRRSCTKTETSCTLYWP